MSNSHIGVDHLTSLDLPPLDFVRAAAAAGFASVSLRTIHIEGGEPVWVGDPIDATGLATNALDLGIRVHAIEAVAITPDLHGSVLSLRPLLEQGGVLGADYLYCFSDDSDTARCADTFSALATLAAEFGLRTLLEPMPYRAIATLQDASDVAAAAERAAPLAHLGAGVIVDVLHANRGGTRPDDLALLPQEQLAVLQLCDAPANAPSSPAASGLHPLMHEARFDRRDPGDGELPLAEFAHAMPSGSLITVEAPGQARRGDYGTRLQELHVNTLAALEVGGDR